VVVGATVVVVGATVVVVGAVVTVVRHLPGGPLWSWFLSPLPHPGLTPDCGFAGVQGFSFLRGSG
ncbi:MAG: hypothetical protein M3378_07925, partial [Actinomycetota bacterium]|nr:hypothetical protein [Actinomycetota bacterium]MDQ3680456.1 hypothetical protein [Actinomycetota bacterium]